ncbi:MAG: autotransporter-associated beta strand repeat-containing protein, partial [Verrucomicrobiota bacterium]
TDSQAASIHAAPGLDAGFIGVDSATFGNTAGSQTVTLDGAAPSLNALIFNNTGSYTLAQGSGSTGITLAGTAPTVTVAGTHTISAPLILASSATITPTNLTDSLTISGVISGSGMNLTKSGAGLLTLSAANTYTGATTLSAGNLTIASSGSINASSGLTIQGGTLIENSATALVPAITFGGTGGTLGGTGTLTQLLTVPVGNTLSPGTNSIGTLSFGNGLTIAGGYAAQLGTPNATAASGLSDRSVVTGNLTLTGGTLALSDNAGANSQGAAAAGAYRLITFTGNLSGTFASVTNPLSATLHEKVVYAGASASSVDLSLFRLATANTLTTPLNLGTFHLGATSSGTALSVTNTAANDGFSEKLSATIGSATGDVVVSGSVSQLAAQSTNNTSLLANVNVSTVGSKSGTATVSLNSDGTGTSGYGTTAIGTQTLTLTGTVYSGLMAWSGASGGSWNNSAGWTDTQAASVHAAPGLATGFSGVDRATFGNTAGSQTVTLDGSAPSLNALTFNNTGSYTIAQGSGSTGITLAGTAPTITAAGTHTISAPLILASSATITPTSLTDSLTFSGVVSGSGMNLTKGGAGLLTLNAANTYTGTTTVTGGTLAIGSAGSLAGGNVTVQAGATLSGGGSIGGSTTLQGIEAPGGSSIGMQTFSNSLTLAATSHLQWQLADNLTTGRGTTFDALNVSGGTFAITPGATIDLSFIGAVNFTNTFWKSNQSWTLVDLLSGLSGTGGTDLPTLGTIAGGSYTNTAGTFSVARVADASNKEDVVLNWTAATSTASPYQTWIDSFSASIPNASDRLPDADPDHDGVTNLAEFAFDGLPNAASSKGLFFTTTKDNNSDGLKELTFTCAVRRSALAFSANANGAQTATIDGVTYTIEGSATLTGTWNATVTYIGKSDTAPAGSSLPSLASTNWEYRTFSAFNGLPGKGFLRARVSIDSTTTATPFQTWIDSFSSSIPNSSDRLPTADPDHDGVTNLAEFAFDGLPNAASSKGLFFTTLKDNNSDGLKELTFTCAVRRSALAFSADANGAQTATIDGVTYTIEGSATLTGTWNTPVTYIGKSDAAPAGSSLPSLAGTNWEYRTFSAFNGLAGKGFLRAKVSQP